MSFSRLRSYVRFSFLVLRVAAAFDLGVFLFMGLEVMKPGPGERGGLRMTFLAGVWLK